MHFKITDTQQYDNKYFKRGNKLINLDFEFNEREVDHLGSIEPVYKKIVCCRYQTLAEGCHVRIGLVGLIVRMHGRLWWAQQYLSQHSKPLCYGPC